MSLGLETLGADEPRLRDVAAWALGELGRSGEAAIPHLRRLLSDEHQWVRDAAKKALERIEGPG